MKMRTCSIFLIWLLVIANCLFSKAYAQEKTKGEKFLTKGEAIVLISATDFMKRKISELLSWGIGYDLSAISQVRLVPTFNYILAIPRKIPPDGRTVLEVRASVDDPSGIANITGVRADLSSIGKLSNMSLVDNGLFGDKKAGDGIFTLQANVSSKIEEGSKDISVAVVNKKGWLAIGKTSVAVRKDPIILEVKLSPSPLPADGKTKVVLYVKVDNPGRIEDVEKATLDLTLLGFPQKLSLRNDGKEVDLLAKDDVFSGSLVLPPEVSAGKYKAVIEVQTLAKGYTRVEIDLEVAK